MNKYDKILTAAIYVRVSTEEQVKEGFSIQAQKESLIEYCKNNNYKIFDFYIDEGKSARAKIKNRTELCRLLEDVKFKKIDRIIFIKLDRWFRNISDYYKVQEILDKYKVEWEATTEDYNTTTSSGRLNLNIRLAIAQDEADRTGDRIRFTFENMVKNKRPIQGSHCLPLGYIVYTDGKNKSVIKDKEKEHIICDMFEHFKLYGSIRKTLLYINEKYSTKIHYDSIRNYFRNSMYTGTYHDIDDYCEAYITKEEFKNNIKRINRNVKDTNKKYDYIFSGLIRCRCCNYIMSGFTHRTTKPKYNKVYTNHAYRCNRSYGSKLCENRSPIFENKLEQYLINNILKLADDYIVKEENVCDIQNIQNVNVNKVKEKIERLSELYIDGSISKEKYNNDFKKYSNEIEKANLVNNKKRDLSNLESLIDSNILSIYNQLNNDNKRAFWNKYIDYIERDKALNFIVHFK